MKTMKSVLKCILFPFVFVWCALAFGIMKLGDGLHWLGNAMTGFQTEQYD